MKKRRVVLALITAGVAIVLWIVALSPMPVWAYLVSAYVGLSIIKIRTFLEHRAHEKARCRSVIIEDRGLLSFLFLKNNLHAVHHSCPNLPWYELEAHYTRRRDAFLTRNGGYAYRSYAQVARLFLLHAKDPVPHTLMPQGPVTTPAPQHSASEHQVS